MSDLPSSGTYDSKAWLQAIEERQEGLESKFDSFAHEIRRDIKDLAHVVGDVSATRGRIEGKALIFVISAFLAALGLAAGLGHQFVQQQFSLAELRSEAIVEGLQSNHEEIETMRDRTIVIAEWKGTVDTTLETLRDIPERVTRNEADNEYAWAEIREHTAKADHPFAVLGRIDSVLQRVTSLEDEVKRIDTTGSAIWRQEKFQP